MVYSVPLLVERRLADAFDVVVTVSAPLESRVARLAASGRMTEEDARARAAAQVSDAEREAVADRVVSNAGDLDELRAADGPALGRAAGPSELTGGRYPRPMTYRAVFFDAGETLVHPHPTFAELFALVLHREGFDVDPAVVADSTHVISERFEEAVSDMWTTSPERSRAFWHSVYERLLEHLGVPNPNGLADDLYAEFTDLSNYALFPDVEDTIARLRAGGLLLGVVSNFEAWLEQLLESLGVAPSFDVRVISGVEGMEKPDPAIFRLALDRAGVRRRRSRSTSGTTRRSTRARPSTSACWAC